jgi:uncharacterized protein YktB (UPF0637 family)
MDNQDSQSKMAKRLRELVESNLLIGEDIVNNDSFTTEDLIVVQDRMKTLIDQLIFWTEQDNDKRFYYDLKDHLNWLLENYS